MATDEAGHVATNVDVTGPPESIDTGASSGANGKRKADLELERATKRSTPATESQEPTTSEAGAADNYEPGDNANKPLSKNQLKRLKRQQQWEEYKQDRRAKRKDKRHERQAR